MAKVVWAERALSHLEEIGDFIAAQDPQVAVAVLQELVNAPNILADHPRIGWREEAVADREVRCLLFGHYRLVYEVVDEETARVSAILHTSRDLSDYRF